MVLQPRTRSNNSCVASSISYSFDLKTRDIFPENDNLSTTKKDAKGFLKKSDREHEEMIFRNGKYLRKLG